MPLETIPDPADEWKATETVLLIDDDNVVRMVSEKFLTRKGFEILTAVDGEDGVETFSENRAQVDVVMLDLTMPRLSGAETFRKLREMSPELPIVIYSGYIVDADEFAEAHGSRPNAVLRKPFDLEGLPGVIHDVLEEAQLVTKAA